MALTGFTFMTLMALTTLVHFVVPKRCQWMVLLAASVVFYLSFGVAQAGYVLITTALSYAGALALRRLGDNAKLEGADKAGIKRRRRLMVVVLASAQLALLLALKYAGMIFPSAGGWIVPLGVSYFTLAAIGYVIDVYRVKYPPEKNPLRLLLFEICFLHIVQGPFGRYDQLGAQLRAQHSLSYDAVKRGALRMLWGYMKKTVAADWFGVYVNAAFGNPEQYGGPTMVIAVVFFSLQMFMDFSGYMDIVCGAGMAMGITVPENFDRPLGAHSTAEFWRRWHITLGAWFRDYVFFPVTVSRPAAKLAKALRGKGWTRLAKLSPALLAMCAVWPLTGLWHGATWNFVLWGCLNGAAIAISMLAEPRFTAWRDKLRIKPQSLWWRALSVTRTFALLSLIRVLITTQDLPQAMGVYRALGRWSGIAWGSITSYGPGMRKLHLGFCAIACVITAIVLFVESRGSREDVFNGFDRWPLLIKYAAAIVMIYLVVLFGASGQSVRETFLYANF